jgi:hypothetical protein
MFVNNDGVFFDFFWRARAFPRIYLGNPPYSILIISLQGYESQGEMFSWGFLNPFQRSIAQQFLAEKAADV